MDLTQLAYLAHEAEAARVNDAPWRAFQGPNGWYVAWEEPDGSHHQDSGYGGTLDQEEAEAMAAQLNEEDEQ